MTCAWLGRNGQGCNLERSGPQLVLITAHHRRGPLWQATPHAALCSPAARASGMCAGPAPRPLHPTVPAPPSAQIGSLLPESAKWAPWRASQQLATTPLPLTLCPMAAEGATPLVPCILSSVWFPEDRLGPLAGLGTASVRDIRW